MTKKEKIKFVAIYNNIVEYPTLKDVAAKLDISESTVRRRRDQLLKDPEYKLVDRNFKRSITDVSFDDKDMEIIGLRKEVSSLKQKLSEAFDCAATDKKILDLIHDLNEHDFEKHPSWLGDFEWHHGSNSGTPLLFISDIHFDEVVRPEQISYVNSYNREIAVSRIKRVFAKTADLLLNHLNSPEYPGIVCALGGDLLAGTIHDEITETIEYPVLDSVVTLTEHLINGIEFLHEKFGKVFVPCVVGNHGRRHKKPRNKNKVYENYEFIIYHYIKKHFEANPDVDVVVSDSSDIQFKIHKVSFLLTHGDQFRGGNGISGIFSPLMLGYHRKNAREASVGRPFDVMLVGHFHQLTMTEKLVINGSIKGYDEYAAEKNLSVEPPQQALMLVHPKYGITFRIPVLCEDECEGKSDIYEPWS